MVYVILVQWKLFKTNYKGTHKISSFYQMFLSGFAYHMHTTTANQMMLDWKLVCIKQKFVLRMFVLTSFYCMYTLM